MGLVKNLLKKFLGCHPFFCESITIIRTKVVAQYTGILPALTGDREREKTLIISACRNCGKPIAVIVGPHSSEVINLEFIYASWNGLEQEVNRRIELLLKGERLPDPYL